MKPKKLIKFSKDFIPLGKEQNKNIFTLSPRISKRKILRRRDPSQNMLDSVTKLPDIIKYDSKSLDDLSDSDYR